MRPVDLLTIAASLALEVSCFLSPATAEAYASGQQPVPSAVIPQGIIEGSRDIHGNEVYLGIPYAATTGGENRWRAPQDVPKWKSRFNATSYGFTCPQASSNAHYSRQDEDCLNLNIWVPPTGDHLPVFVYILFGTGTEIASAMLT